MLTSWHLNKKRREVRIKARSHQALFAFIDQAVTKPTTVKWPVKEITCLFTLTTFWSSAIIHSRSFDFLA